MANTGYSKFRNGISIAPAASSVAVKGDIAYNSGNDTLEVYTTGVETVATNSNTITLSNKTLLAPALGTPVSGVLTNCTGTASGLTAGTVTTNANLTGPITSSGNATSVASQTGTGTTFVMNASPTLVTPNLGTPSTLVGTNITGTASGFTAGNVTTNANLTGVITSSGNATSTGVQTGTGNTFAMSVSPTFTGTLSAATVSATARITSTYSSSGGGFTAAPATATAAATFESANNSNTSYFGNESSAGGTTFAGSTAYATIVGNTSTVPVQVFTNNILALTIDTSQNSNFAGAIGTPRLTDSSTLTPRNGLSSTSTSYVVFTGSATITINGIVAGISGQRLVLANSTGNSMTIVHQSGSASGSKILCPNDADITILQHGALEVIYDAASDFWRAIKYS